MMSQKQGTLNASLPKTVIVGLITSSLLLAQSQAEETNAPTQLKPTVVTGSLIPTFETITAAPVDVYTIEAIERSGVDSVQQLIQRLPAISGNASFGDSRGNGGDGSAAVGLRNIPLGTLVLIDGRRVAPNQLPLAANVDINASAAVPVLAQCLKDFDPTVAVQSAEALGRLGVEAGVAVPALAKSMEDFRPGIQLAAAGALSKFGQSARPAVPALLKALSNSDFHLRLAATNALESIAPEVLGTNGVSGVRTEEK